MNDKKMGEIFLGVLDKVYEEHPEYIKFKNAYMLDIGRREKAHLSRYFSSFFFILLSFS